MKTESAAHLKTTDADSFYQEGYVILDLFDDQWLAQCRTLVLERINALCKKNGITPNDPNWTLGDYHEAVASDDSNHRTLMKHADRYINLTEELAAPLYHPTVLEILKHYWGHSNPMITHRAHEIEDADEGDYASCFRFVRPGVRDVTGVHVDTYFGADADLYNQSLDSCLRQQSDDADLITIWFPLVGFDERYSLRFAPGTHLIAHPLEAFVKSPEFITKAVTAEYEAQFDHIRPKLLPGQAIVFHPNLMHGGSMNDGDMTRVSMEIRLHNPSPKNLNTARRKIS